MIQTFSLLHPQGWGAYHGVQNLGVVSKSSLVNLDLSCLVGLSFGVDIPSDLDLFLEFVPLHFSSLLASDLSGRNL